jgi:magnesium transporter
MAAWFKRRERRRGNVRFEDEEAASLVRVTTKSDNGSDEDESTDLLITRETTSNSTDARIMRKKLGSVDNLTALVEKPKQGTIKGSHAAANQYQIRHKKPPSTHWVSIDSEGVCHRVTADKRAITKAKELGVTTRELRMFDQIYGHVHGRSTRILVRENALLFVMEGYRLIITRDEVLIPLFGLPASSLSSLIKELESVLMSRHRLLVRRREQRENPFMQQDTTVEPSENEEEEEELLPFELAAFEVAIKMVVGNLKDQIVTLDEACHPALEALSQKVDRMTLDHVRVLKNKHSTLTKNVEAVVEELERIMDDDDDMKRMVLSEDDVMDMPFIMDSLFNSGYNRSCGTPRTPHSSESYQSHQKLASDLGTTTTPTSFSQAEGVAPRLNKISSFEKQLSQRSNSLALSVDGDHCLMMVENLLEFYFALLDQAFDCLKTLEEIIDNTEEMIDIELDTARNRLIKLEILLTGCTFTFTIYAVVAGVLGENIKLPEVIADQFLLVNLVTMAICCVIMFALYTWCKWENLM